MDNPLHLEAGNFYIGYNLLYYIIYYYLLIIIVICFSYIYFYKLDFILLFIRLLYTNLYQPI